MIINQNNLMYILIIILFKKMLKFSLQKKVKFSDKYKKKIVILRKME